MKILVAGARGQLGRALLEQQARLGSEITVTALGRPQLDLLDKAAIARAIGITAPDVVINAAAYTAVDKAENDATAAFAVNRDGAGDLAAATRMHACPIIHVSTDYVFDGTKQGAYTEDDATGPTTVYGRSKLEGEIAVAAANPQHIILRTAWVYSAHGHNFLKTMVRLARERPELRIVVDQRGNPTYAPHLASAILAIAAQLGTKPGRWGTYHAAGTGETSWYGFASAIIGAAAPTGGPRVLVKAISTSDYPTPAKRPANSCLDCTKLARVLGVRLPPWQQGLAECMTQPESTIPGGEAPAEIRANLRRTERP